LILASIAVNGFSNIASMVSTIIGEVIFWEYSTDSGTSFTNGINSSFMLNEGTYGTNAIQIRQTDVAGNVSDIGKILWKIRVNYMSNSITLLKDDGTNVY
jgi:hypothetical protein